MINFFFRKKGNVTQLQIIHIMKLFTQNKKLGFSLIELSVVILIIGILIIGVSKGSILLNEAKLKSAKSLTSASPLHTMDDLALWLETTNSENIATGAFNDNPLDFGSALYEDSPISSWRYSIVSKTSSIDLTPADNDARPTYVENAINGLPAIKFDDSDDTLRNAQGAIPAGQERYTMIAVFTMNVTGSPTITPFAQVGNCTGTGTGIISQLTQVGYYGCGGGEDLRTTETLSNDTSYIVSVVTDKTNGTPISIYLNSNTVNTSGDTTNGVGVLADGPMIVGSISAGSLFMSELIVFNDALNSSEIENVQNYLSSKYSINLN
jgi:prepilin-type N-terminal cleavage/methylation domain-containing protein